MSTNYLNQVLSKYKLNDNLSPLENQVKSELEDLIKEWREYSAENIYISGSRAKGTAINLNSDFDLFISIRSDNEETLGTLFNSLYSFFKTKSLYSTKIKKLRKQNVSIGLSYYGIKVDLVPGKKDLGNTNYHKLYKNKTDSWQKTNIKKHIDIIKDSGRTDEIIALKVWRELHNLDFPSIYLELSTLEALKYKNKNNLDDNFLSVLNYLQNEFKSKKIEDPSNTNNIISDDLYKYQKENIANKASESLEKTYWRDIIW